jgi:hypothetical protein
VFPMLICFDSPTMAEPAKLQSLISGIQRTRQNYFQQNLYKERILRLILPANDVYHGGGNSTNSVEV